MTLQEDNQQRLRDLGWLGGMIDGDGSLGFHRDSNNKYYPRIRITTTDKQAVKRIQTVIENIGSKSTASWQPPHKHQNFPFCEINMVGKENITNILTTIPLVIKRNLSDALRMFITTKDGNLVSLVHKINYSKAFNDQIPNIESLEKIGWLSGLVDAEGCLTFAVPSRLDENRKMPTTVISVANFFKPCLNIVNTFLNELGIASYIRQHEVIIAADSKQRFLDIIGPNLTIKQNTATVLNEWLTLDKSDRLSQHGIQLINSIRTGFNRRTLLCACGQWFKQNHSYQMFHNSVCKQRFSEDMI